MEEKEVPIVNQEVEDDPGDQSQKFFSFRKDDSTTATQFLKVNISLSTDEAVGDFSSIEKQRSRRKRTNSAHDVTALSSSSKATISRRTRMLMRSMKQIDGVQLKRMSLDELNTYHLSSETQVILDKLKLVKLNEEKKFD